MILLKLLFLIFLIQLFFIYKLLTYYDSNRRQPFFWWLVSYSILIVLPAFYQVVPSNALYEPFTVYDIILVLLPIPFTNISYWVMHQGLSIKRFRSFSVIEETALIRLVRRTIIVICGFVFLYVVFFSSSLPLVQAIKGAQYSVLVMSREKNRTSIFPIPYFEFWVRQIFMPIIVAWYMLSTRNKKNIFSYFRKILVLMLALFFGALNLVKSPSVVIFIIWFFASNISKGEKINIKKIFFLLFIVMAIVLLILYLQVRDRNLIFTIQAIFKRILLTPSGLLAVYFHLFHDWKLGGISINFIASINKVATFPITNYVYRYLVPNGLPEGTAPAPFLGDMYANWGIIGIILSSMLLGTALAIGAWLFSNSKQSFFEISLYAGLFYAFFETNRTSLPSAFFSYGVIPIIGIILLIRLFKTIY